MSVRQVLLCVFVCVCGVYATGVARASVLTVTINQAGGQSDPTNAFPINFTVVFSETVTDFATGDVTLSGTAGATTATVSGGGTNYNVAVTGMTTSGTVTTDAVGNTGTDTLQVQCTDSNPGTAWQGIAMVSLPIVPDSTDPKAVVGFDGNYWYLLDASTGAYVGYPDTRTMLDPAAKTPGRGFWARFAAGASPHPCGTIPDQTQAASIHLLPGWNLIGQPFIKQVKWDLSAIQVTSDGVTNALRDAYDAVCGYAWGWNASVAAYYLVYDASIAPPANRYLDPWQAFWIKAAKECDLILPAP